MVGTSKFRILTSSLTTKRTVKYVKGVVDRLHIWMRERCVLVVHQFLFITG
jgi:hypothetical protein